jgi:transmembrane sensor
MDENYLLAKWLNDDMTASEVATFKETEDYALYQKIKDYSSHLAVGDFNEEKVLENILKEEKLAPKSIPLYKKWFVQIAAVLVIGLGITFIMQDHSSVNQLAQNGEKTSFLLPDNSEVVLNSGSEIHYEKWNWENNRELKLEGEAYFTVAKGKRFEVVTNLGKVAVLGTQFNVKARTNRFEVICFEGKVQVNYEKAKIVLTPGQSVTFENGKQTNITVPNSKPLWLKQKMSFEKERLDQVIAEVQRQYNVSIVLKSKKTNALFSGKIPTDNLDTALQIIGTTYNLKFSKTTANKIIFQEK